jgi:hypothetical protein
MEVVTHHIHTRTLGWSACASRTAVNPSLGAAGKTSLFFTLREAHADQPLGPDCGALYGRARVRMTYYSHHTDAGRHEEVDPVMAVAPLTRANAIDTNRGHRAQTTGRTLRCNGAVVRRGSVIAAQFLGASKTGRFCRRLQGRIHAVPKNEPRSRSTVLSVLCLAGVS